MKLSFLDGNEWMGWTCCCSRAKDALSPTGIRVGDRDRPTRRVGRSAACVLLWLEIPNFHRDSFRLRFAGLFLIVSAHRFASIL